jgi:hypothetical protein
MEVFVRMLLLLWIWRMRSKEVVPDLVTYF